jgi:hypothetical protein
VPEIVRQLRSEYLAMATVPSGSWIDLAWSEALYCADGFENIVRELSPEQQASVKARFVERFGR